MDYNLLILIFTSIVYEAMPFIVLGVVLAGLLEEFVPQEALTRIIPKNLPLALLIGTLLGLVFPMCECGIIVVMRRLLRKGLPLSVCVAYMLAGPIVNGVVMLSTFVAFNTPEVKDRILGGPVGVVMLRVGFGIIVAFVTGLFVEREYRRYGNALLAPSIAHGLEQPVREPSAAKRTWRERLGNITQTALNDFIDILTYLVLGAMLAGIGRLVLQENKWDQQLQGMPVLSILLGMGLAVLFCLCSEADAFVAANFGAFWPPAAKLAFMVLGPMLDLKLILMYTRVFRARLIFVIVRWVTLMVFLLCYLLHLADQAGGVSEALGRVSYMLGI